MEGGRDRRLLSLRELAVSVRSKFQLFSFPLEEIAACPSPLKAGDSEEHRSLAPSSYPREAPPCFSLRFILLFCFLALALYNLSYDIFSPIDFHQSTSCRARELDLSI